MTFNNVLLCACIATVIFFHGREKMMLSIKIITEPYKRLHKHLKYSIL